MSTIVIMPGGFHPFHAGHFALYQSALKAFPGAEVYVAATNDQSERPFPFALKEKLAKLAGVKQGHFVQVKSPFQSKEITQNYNPEQDVLIFVRSEKDRNESPKPGGTKKDGSPAYFQPWTGKDVQPFAKHAYFAYLPTVEFGPGITSATQIRKAWPTLNDKRKTAMVMSLYPAAQKNPKLAQTVVGMFDQVMGGQEQLAEASYMSLDDYKNNLQNALPSIIEYYQDELGFMPSKEQLASAVKAAHATMERTGDTEQAGESLEAVLDSFVPSNSSNKNSPKIDFKKNLLQVLQQKYPDAEFKIGPDRVESIDGQLSVIADTEQEGKYVGCFMWDVSTGPYKGALGIAIKKTTDQLLQANPGKKPALFISGDNQNPKAWSHIAKKLKYKLITDEDELEEGYLDDEDDEPPYHTRILDRQTKKVIADDGPYESENEAVDRAEAYLAWAKTKDMSIVAQVYQPEHGKNYVTWQVPDGGDYTVKEQGVAEGTRMPDVNGNYKFHMFAYLRNGDIKEFNVIANGDRNAKILAKKKLIEKGYTNIYSIDIQGMSPVHGPVNYEIDRKLRLEDQGVAEGWKGAVAGGIAGGMIGGFPGALLGGAGGYVLGGGNPNEDLPDDIESAYELGQQAARDGKTEEDNPYEEGMLGPSRAMEAWHDGWESVDQGVTDTRLTKSQPDGRIDPTTPSNQPAKQDNKNNTPIISKEPNKNVNPELQKRLAARKAGNPKYGGGLEEGSQSKDDLIWTLNNFDYYTDNGNVYVNDNGDKIARIGSNWKHQSGKMGSGAEELSAFLSSLQDVNEGFGINYPGTYEQENNMFKGHGQRRIGNLTSENVDPELINVLQYAQQHYPNSKNKQEAFMKFVQRALGHSKSDDERQDNELERLDKEVDQLQKQVNVSESTDYLEEK